MPLVASTGPLPLRLTACCHEVQKRSNIAPGVVLAGHPPGTRAMAGPRPPNSRSCVAWDAPPPSTAPALPLWLSSLSGSSSNL